MKIIFDSEEQKGKFLDGVCPSAVCKDFIEHRDCGNGRHNLCEECWEQSGLKYEIKGDQTAEEFQLNLNDIIRVKFTDYGKDIYYHQHDDFIEKYGIPMSRSYPNVDEEGYTDIELWMFMQIFGSHYLKFGMANQTIEANTIYIPKETMKMTSLKDYYEMPFVDLVYETVKNESQGLDSIYRDYIINLVGVMGLNALIEHKLVEGCGIVNERKLYVLCERNNGKANK